MVYGKEEYIQKKHSEFYVASPIDSQLITCHSE